MEFSLFCFTLFIGGGVCPHTCHMCRGQRIAIWSWVSLYCGMQGLNPGRQASLAGAFVL